MKRTPLAFVLRVGFVLEGRVVQERVVDAGAPVTIGTDARNTFSFNGAGLPKRHVLFSQKGGGYRLYVDERMAGKVAGVEGTRSLEDCRSAVHPERGRWAIPLSPQVRGKVQIGELIVLFQFVPPPPEMLRIVSQGFRPRLIDPDDPVFLGFLGLWSSLGAMLMMFVWNHPPVEYTELELGIEQRIIALKLPPPETEPPEPTEIEPIDDADGPAERVDVPEPVVDATPPEEPATEPAEPSPIPDDPSDWDARDAAAHQDMVDEVIAESPLMAALIATTGANNSGIFIDEDPMGQTLREDLDGVRGYEIADSAGLAQLRQGEFGDTENRGIGALHRAGGDGDGTPTADLDGIADFDPVVEPQDDGVEDISGAPVGDVEAVRRAVRGYMGQVRRCYVQALNKDPAVQGRVSVHFEINRGRVLNPTLFDNSTGDTELGACIVRRVGTWRFDQDLQMELVYPFVLSL